MLSVPWFLGWTLRPYIQINPPPTPTITTDRGEGPADQGTHGSVAAKAQVAQLSSPSAARHVTARTPSPTSPTTSTPPSSKPYPVTIQPISAKDNAQTKSAPVSQIPTSIAKTTATRTASAPTTGSPKPAPPTGTKATTGKPETAEDSAGNLVSTKTITLKMSVEWVQQQLEQFRFSFDEADRDKSGFLSLDEVFSVISKHGFKGSKDQAKQLFAQLDANNDQKLTSEEFTAALGKLPRNTIKEFVLRKTFQQMDKDGSGKLSRTEIEDATKTQAELDIPAEKIAQLLIVLSKDTKDDVVDYEEFLQVFGIQTTGDVMETVFRQLDKDGSGYLTKDEILAAVYAESELKLRAAKISDLLIAWHKDSDKKINYQEFVQVWTKYK